MPKAFDSGTPPQFVFKVTGRAARGPMPSRQWYSSAKQPPGQRTTGTCSSRKRCNHVIAKAADIGNRGALAHPHAFFDAAAEVLGKLPENMPIDLRAGLIRMNHGTRAGVRRLLCKDLGEVNIGNAANAVSSAASLRTLGGIRGILYMKATGQLSLVQPIRTITQTISQLRAAAQDCQGLLSEFFGEAFEQYWGRERMETGVTVGRRGNRVARIVILPSLSRKRRT